MGGEIARQMAAAPTEPKERKPKNRFDPIFGEIVFKAVTGQNDPLVYRDGTKQTRLALVAIELKGTKAYINGASIVRLQKDGQPDQFRLNLPSMGGQFKRPVFDTSEDENASNDLNEFGRNVVEQWKGWRKRQVAAGTAAAVVSTSKGIAVNPDELKELGL